MTLYDFVTAVTDKRLPPFGGAGVRREGGQVSFGKGKGRFFLAQTLTVLKRDNGKFIVSNRAY